MTVDERDHWYFGDPDLEESQVASLQRELQEATWGGDEK
jgi:hypothetical protein